MRTWLKSRYAPAGVPPSFTILSTTFVGFSGSLVSAALPKSLNVAPDGRALESSASVFAAYCKKPREIAAARAARSVDVISASRKNDGGKFSARRSTLSTAFRALAALGHQALLGGAELDVRDLVRRVEGNAQRLPRQPHAEGLPVSRDVGVADRFAR